MTHTFGLVFAFTALVCWGFGDFFIQRVTRVVGSWKALFFIGFVGMVGLFPFIRNDFGSLTGANWWLLGLLAVVVIFASLFDFEALRQGKIAIVEPIIGLELPLTVGLSIVLAKESLAWEQAVLIGVVFIGIMLAVTEHHSHWHYHKRILERGVILAGVGAIGMALTNFLVGVASQEISALMAVWFGHTAIAVICGLYLLGKGELKSLWTDLKKNPKIIIGQSLLDNIAWVSYAKAMTLMPIAIATTMSESYIALAVLLGLFINREKLKRHQLVGAVLATGGVILLALFS